VGPTGSRPTGDAVARRGGMDALFQMQKALAVGVYQQLGVQLSPAERERVMRIPTTNLHAVLAFGRGLQAADAGQWAQAADHFLEAARLDPNFAPAAGRASEALHAARALAVTTADLATMARIKLEHGAELLDAVDALLPGAQVGTAVAQLLGIGGLRERAVRVERLLRRP